MCAMAALIFGSFPFEIEARSEHIFTRSRCLLILRMRLSLPLNNRFRRSKMHPVFVLAEFAMTRRSSNPVLFHHRRREIPDIQNSFQQR